MDGADFRQQEESLHQQEQEMTDLLKINVNDHTEKKGQLTYLSWAWAWAEVLKVDPKATWCVHQYGPQGSEQPCMWIGETAMVHTSVTINGIRRECMLPVMDHKNNAMKNPDARKVSDSIMRCMTKAIGMHGLGLYIYAGEDLPEGEESQAAPERSSPEPQRSRPVATPKRGAHADVLATTTEITAQDKRYLDELADRVCTTFDAEGTVKAFEVIDAENLDHMQKIYLSSVLPSGVRNPIKEHSIAVHEAARKRSIAAKHPAIAVGQPA
jgi:hypothetical protein